MSKKIPGIVDVAKLSGVSTATVSRVLNGSQHNVSEALKKRVMDAMEELDYTPNLIGRQLKTKRGGDIAIVVQNLSNPFYPEIIRGVESKLRMQNEYNLAIYNSYGSKERELQFLKSLPQRNTRGLMLSTCTYGIKSAPIIKCVNNLRDSGVKIVMYDQELEGVDSSSVLFDMRQAGRLAVEHFCELGHKRIAIANSPLTRHSRITLFDSFRYELAMCGLELPEEYYTEALPEEDYSGVNYSFDNGRYVAEELLKLDNPPTAIFATNDLIAYGIIRTLQERKIKIGKEISVIGFNDLFYSSMTWPPLTTIRQPLFEMGQEAFRLLNNEMNNETAPVGKFYLSVNMVKRGTSGVCQDRKTP